MHNARGEGPVRVVEDPPLAGIAAARDRQTTFGLRPVASCADVLHDPGREQPHAVDLALVQHEEPQPAQIAQTGGRAAAREGNALAVDRLVGVRLGSHELPEPLGRKVGGGLTGRPADDPAQHVGVDRPVMERGAVLAVGPHLLQILPVSVWPVGAIGLGKRTLARGAEPDVGVRIRIALGKANACGHLHDLAHHGVGKRAAADFRIQVSDDSRVVQYALDDQNLGQQPGDHFVIDMAACFRSSVRQPEQRS